MESLNYDQMDFAMDRIQALCDAIRPDAIGLTDALGHSDSSLKSTLGRRDGNVYEAIYAEAKKNPLNTDGDVMVGWEYFKEVLNLDFLREGEKIQRSSGVASSASSHAAFTPSPASPLVPAATRAKL